MVEKGVDKLAVEGIANTPYAIANFAVDWVQAVSPVTTLWWRSVAHTHTAHAVEVTIDELAHAANADPVAFRLALLAHHPRHATVLRLAAEKGQFAEKLPPGKGRGIALHESFGTVVAMVAEVSVSGAQVKVEQNRGGGRLRGRGQSRHYPRADRERRRLRLGSGAAQSDHLHGRSRRSE